MKITYTFLKGEDVVVDTTEEMASLISDFNRKEDNLARKERYHCYSLDFGQEIGFQYKCESNIEELFREPSMEEKLHIAISQLKPKQKDLIKAIYFDGVLPSEYAEKQGVGRSAISNQLRRAEKKLKNLLEKM